MPELSQRSLGRIIPILTYIPQQHGVKSYSERQAFWRTKLFEHGLPPWLVDFVLDSGMDWSMIIPTLHGGKVMTRSEIIVNESLRHQMLRRLVVFACMETGAENRATIGRSIALDGFGVTDGKLQPIDGPISIDDEKSLLLTYLKTSRLGRQDVIKKHIQEAEELFSAGKPHPAIGEARSAFQAVIEETTILQEVKVQKKSGGSTKDKVNFLQQHAFLSDEECSAVFSAWGFLSSGSHPGMSSDESGRIGTILCFEFIQVLLIKAKSLL